LRKLFARQLEKVTATSGAVDLDALARLVTAAYEEADHDRLRTDRSISLMVEELDQLTSGLEQQVQERTAKLREREAQLRAQHRVADAALTHMSQALVMYDAEGRLIVSNRRFAEMYRLRADSVRAGATLRELLALRKKSRTFSGDPEAHAKVVQGTVAAGKIFSRLAELPDGRTISIVSVPTADGGWVSTHEDMTERRRAERQIEHLARHDVLTDLPNRMMFRERLAHALATMRRGERVAVLSLNLDQFKNINDSLGHLIGDELLRAVADRLRGCVRDADPVARVGGDEFAIAQTGIRNATDTANLVRRIGEAIRAPFQLQGNTAVVDISIGIAVAPNDGKEANELLKNADMALYGAKTEGRGTCRFFEPIMDARMKARRNVEIALRNSLAAGDFELHYQPMIALADDRVTGCEALMRWRHPERGPIPPSEFIPVAEEIGLIVQMGEWVLRKALADAAQWPDDLKVSVNLSPIQMMHPNLVPAVVHTLAKTGVPARRLEIEITESVLMQNAETTLATLHQLRELGVRISLDDFGTGYSSLSYLRSFPFDKIKIDRCFIHGLSDGDDSAAIVRAVVGLARDLKIATTAEGVETPDQLAQVRALGCDEVQGFLLSRPQPIENLSSFLGRRPSVQSIIAA
jgi:diguanylate cyclase (GGDEF)-like protein